MGRPWTSFVGRDRDLRLLRQLVHAAESGQPPRLVTLTGPGGVGKTRLALEWATTLRDEGARQVCLVRLDPLNHASLVVPTIAATLGVDEVPGEPLINVLQKRLRDDGLLLVLDNFEHVAEAAADVAELLQRTSRLQVLATSRMPLGVYGEQEAVVSPLETVRTGPVAEPSPAERLFVDRARAVKPEFALTADNAAAVSEICARLDGLPLAIELAAVRVRVLNPSELLKHLEQRLAILVGGPSDLPTRHRALRATIDWSFDLLAPSEQLLFRRLAVFVGGFSLQAAEAVVASEPLHPGIWLLDELTSLVAKNLLCQDTDADPDGAPRFAFLQIIREYALERLEASGEHQVLHERLARFYLDLALAAEPRLAGPDQASWLARLERSLDNLRAALDWWLARDPEGGLRCAVALSRFWLVRGHLSEGRTWLTRLLARATVQCDPVLRARALETTAQLARQQGDYDAAGSLHAESLAILRGQEDPSAVARALFELGVTFFYQAELTASRPLFEESLSMALAAGDRSIAGLALFRLANLAHLASDYAEARRLHQEALALLRQVGDRRAVADSLFNLGYVAADQGDVTTASAYLEESLVLMNELRDPRGLAWVLEGFAQLAAPTRPERAVRLAGTAARLRDEAGARMPPAAREHFERVLEPARLALSGEDWAACWEGGWAMPLEQALAEALAL